MDEKKRTTMSVPEMRRMLGLGKTDSYWLVHRQCFETIIVAGKMRVVIDSFEHWYANQIKYKKGVVSVGGYFIIIRIHLFSTVFRGERFPCCLSENKPPVFHLAIEGPAANLTRLNRLLWDFSPKIFQGSCIKQLFVVLFGCQQPFVVLS